MSTLITSKGPDIDENIANQNHATRTRTPKPGYLNLSSISYVVMANALEKYSKTKFKKDIAVDTEHYSPYIRKLGDEAKDIPFTIQLP